MTEHTRSMAFGRRGVALVALFAATLALTVGAQGLVPAPAGAMVNDGGECTGLEWVWEVIECETRGGGGSGSGGTGDPSPNEAESSDADTETEPQEDGSTDAGAAPGKPAQPTTEPTHDDDYWFWEEYYLKRDYEQCAEIERRLDADRIKRNPPRRHGIRGFIKGFAAHFKDVEIEPWRRTGLNVRWRRLGCSDLIDLVGLPPLPADE